MNKPKIQIGPIFLEAFFVVLGVILALAANEWRQSYNEDQRTEQALDAIHEEINLNQTLLHESLEYHAGIMDSLRAFQRQGRAGYPSPAIFRKGFMHPTELVTISWELAVSTDAVGNLDYDRALAYARVYDRYAQYEQQQTRVSELIYERLFSEGFEGVLRNHVNLSTILGTFAFVECDLLGSVDEYRDSLPGLELVDSATLPAICTYLRR